MAHLKDALVEGSLEANSIHSSGDVTTGGYFRWTYPNSK